MSLKFGLGRTNNLINLKCQTTLLRFVEQRKHHLLHVNQELYQFSCAKYRDFLQFPLGNKYKLCKSRKRNICAKVHDVPSGIAPVKGTMWDDTTRFKCKGKTVYHYMGTSTFSQYTVVDDIGLAKVDPKASLDKICLSGCGVSTGYGVPIQTANMGCDATNAKTGKDNITAVLQKIGEIRLEQRPIPKIADNEVLIHMDSVGICGSDVHFLVHGRIGDFVLKAPMIIGHEAAGIVDKVGKKVKNLKVGDRVAVEPGVPCRICELCKLGKYNLCPEMAFCACPPYDGNLTRYYKHPADFCYKLPDHVTMEEGVLLEPLSVSVRACRRANVGLGSEVLILGAGPIGLVTLLCAKAMGASKILVTDLKQSRLDFAKEMGATHTLLTNPEEKPEDLAKCVHQVMGSEPDKSIDCCGFESAMRLGIFATRAGGCFIVIGLGSPDAKLPIINVLAREIDIRGVFRYCNDYAPALALISSGEINIRCLITHHFDIKDTVEAFDTVRYGKGDPIKVIIHVQPEGTNNK